MVNNFCLCITQEGYVHKSSTWSENLLLAYQEDHTPPDEFMDACPAGSSIVFNAVEYFQNPFGFCNAYKLGKTCKIQEQQKIIKMLKGKKSKKSKSSRKNRW